MPSIQDYRNFYANFVVRSEGSSNEQLIAAFATVERERFVGRGPWPIFIGNGYIPTVSDDPSHLYQDILVGLATDRGINNGQPTLHARCLAACDPKPGETVVHVGAGTGYYTAILASLVGPTGRVLAYEIESDLAGIARNNLRYLPNVDVLCASGIDAQMPKSHVIYVCAGATNPPDSWFDALMVGGRVAFPLTPTNEYGCMLLVTRRSETEYAASSILRVAFIPCVGAQDATSSHALATAMRTSPHSEIRSLRRGTRPDQSAWHVAETWWLSTEDESATTKH